MDSYPEMEETYRFIAEQLNSLDIAHIHLVDQRAWEPRLFLVTVKEKIRSAFQGCYLLSGGYNLQKANEDLHAGKGELVAFGRPLIANPDLAERLQNDFPLHSPDLNTFYAPGEAGYTNYSRHK